MSNLSDRMALPLAGALALAGLGLSACLVVCLFQPASGAGALIGPLFSDPDVPAASYVSDLSAAEGARGPDRQLRLRAAENDALSETAAAPLKADAWLRLAYVRAVEGGALNGKAALALRASYEAAPVDPKIAVSRIGIAFQGWESLPEDLRAAAEGETAGLWSVDASQREALVQTIARLRNPRGRAAAEALLARLRSAS